MMKKPATTWPSAVPTSVTRLDELAVACWVGDRLLGLVDVGVDLRVAGVQRPVAQPVLDLVEALDDLVGEVAARRSRPAGRRRSAARRRSRSPPARRGRPPAPRGRPSRCSPTTAGPDQRGDQQRDDERQRTTTKKPSSHSEHEAGRRDDEEAPGPGGRQVEAPRHLGAAEVGGPGDDRLGLGALALGAELRPLRRPAAGPARRSSRPRRSAAALARARGSRRWRSPAPDPQPAAGPPDASASLLTASGYSTRRPLAQAQRQPVRRLGVRRPASRPAAAST